jgi:hypothetical protein
MPGTVDPTLAIACNQQMPCHWTAHPGIADALQLGHVHAGRDLPMIARPVNNYGRRFKI